MTLCYEPLVIIEQWCRHGNLMAAPVDAKDHLTPRPFEQAANANASFFR